MSSIELQALIFDVDGTLADTERDGHRVAFNRAFADAGLDWHWDIDRYGELLAVTGGKERIRYDLSQTRPEWLTRPDIDTLIAQLHQAKTRHYVALGNAGALPLRPGVARLVNEARQAGLRLAIATTTTLDNVSVLLERALGPGSAAWFECIGAGDVVAAKKPAPDIYLWVLQQLQIKPEACLAFEDSENGLRAAQAAGLATIVTINAYTDGQDFAGALAVLSDLGEDTAPYRRLAGAGPDRGTVAVPVLRRWHSANAA